jgi:glycosidase
MEFHISKSIRDKLKLSELLFSYSGNVVFANVAASRKLAQQLNELPGAQAQPVHAAALFAMGLIDELSHALVARYRREQDPEVMSAAAEWLGSQVTPAQSERLLLEFVKQFPTVGVYRGEQTPEQWLKGTTKTEFGVEPNRAIAMEEMLLLWLANRNPAFVPFQILFGDAELKKQTAYEGATKALPKFFATRPAVDEELGTLLEALQAPMLASPDSLTGQLDYIAEKWSPVLGEELKRVLLAIDVLREEEIAVWMQFHPARPDNYRHGEPGRSGEGFVGDEYIGFESEYVTGTDGVRRRREQLYAEDYQAPLVEYEAFSADQAWMPTVVLMAKSTYVWLEQLSKKYGRHIQRLDQIPDEELRLLAERGITGLWLIGLWERSRASKTIKRLRGNPDAVASAYSLKDYSIAEDIGGEAAYRDLKHRAGEAGLRLASDMVPNHMGIDSDWVIENPDWFLYRWESPFPVYRFEGPDLSTDSRVEIKIEDHYYDQTDAAVVFRLRHYRDGATRYMYHGNDGTTFAWNDTAQLDYSKAEVREHVMQVILDVARRFPIIRFDAAMVLAKRHVQRLWFPLPGAGGSIPSRAENAISDEQFNEMMPHEFWREVVDRVAVEVPGTLLLAEAFWLLESYFVRTLGMHRVYNSAFMNMLRDEENAKYRSYLKKTVEFDPDILKRYVNFMSNPDEKTAIDQFGAGDKYFGTSVLLATLPGLPMFGHGQIEGYTERYGMDFKRARLEEYPNDDLVNRHMQLIAPLLKNRHIFAESTHFVMYDFWTGGRDMSGDVDENVFAYSNMSGKQKAIILFNNRYGATHGTVKSSVAFLDKQSGQLRNTTLSAGLQLPWDDDAVMAYKDTVQGLEYLRRARDLRDHGLTVGLRGYQHMVLLEWRVLYSSETHPWDRLCDTLQGAGVYSVDEAMQQLRLQPLVEALRRVVNEGNVHLMAKVAGEVPVREVEAKAVAPVVVKKGTRKKVAELKVAAPALEEQDGEPASHRSRDQAAARIGHPGIFAEEMERIVAGVRGFAETAVRLGRWVEPEVTVEGKIGESVVHPTTIEALQGVLQSGLVGGDKQVSEARMWAPVLGWMALRGLPSAQAAVTLFDELQMRHALAETFSSVGVKGEEAWRAAAQVRVLLRVGVEGPLQKVIETAAFWEDADVRWLTGTHADEEGVEYFEQERFEALVRWLQLPALVAGVRDEAFATKLVEAAKNAGYKMKAFVEALLADEMTVAKRKEKTKESVTMETVEKVKK